METIPVRFVAVLPHRIEGAALTPNKRRRRRSVRLGAAPVLFMVLLACATRHPGRLRVVALSHRAFQCRHSVAHSTQFPPVRLVNPTSHWHPSAPCVSRRISSRLYSSTQLRPSHEADALFLEGLNVAQAEAVTQPLASITRVVAGPGAGKTRVLTSRIAYLLHHDDQDRHILAVTFTKKASGEMQQRLEKLLLATSPPQQRQELENGAKENNIVQEEVAGPGSSPRPSTALDRVTLGTFHSVCAKILRWNGKLLSALPSVVREMAGSVNATTLDGNFNIIDQNQQVRLVKECQADLDIDLKSQDLKPQAVLNAMVTVKSKLDQGQDPLKDGRKIPSKALQAAAKIFPLYREKLLSRNSLDFDDLILMARELLTEHEDIRDRLRKRWQHVLVDEFQDTSKSQLDLVKLLSSNSLLVVGDADQSIYSWRGAHVESMSDFIHEFHDRLDGVNTVYLMENYRSTTNIVNAAQRIISSTSTESKQSDLRQDMKPMRGAGPTPRVLACADAKAEASFVVKTIQDMLASGDYTSDSTVAMIYRTNAQSRALEEACVQANMPYVVRGSSGSFYKRAEIQDCLCFLRLLHNGRDEVAMKRAIKTPSRGIGDVAYQEFRQYCAQVEAFYESNHPDEAKPNPFEILISLTDDLNGRVSSGLVEDIPQASDVISKRALNRFVPFSMQMRLIRSKAQKLTVAGLLSGIIVNLDLRNHIDSISKSKSEFSDRWSNVMELRRAAQKYSDEGASVNRRPADESDTEDQNLEYAESPLGKFLDDVALVTDMADEAARSEGKEKSFVANLMTIHASKGMEFDGVFLVGNEDGTLPTQPAITAGDGSVALDEEKRLCYVAMTRAKTHLVMTWRREVEVFNRDYLSRMKATRSRFLDVLVARGGKEGKKQGNPGKGERQRAAGNKTNGSMGRHVNSRSSSLPRAGTARVQPRTGPNSARRALTTSAKPEKRVVRATPSSKVDLPPKAVSRSAIGAAKQPYEVQRRAILRTNEAPRSTRNGKASTVEPKGKTGSTQTATRNGSETMDSTWFYPIGSSVVHTRHGRGLVLPPPPLDMKGEMLVRVQFEDGTKHDLPAVGNDLHLNLS